MDWVLQGLLSLPIHFLTPHVNMYSMIRVATFHVKKERISLIVPNTDLNSPTHARTFAIAYVSAGRKGVGVSGKAIDVSYRPARLCFRSGTLDPNKSIQQYFYTQCGQGDNDASQLGLY